MSMTAPCPDTNPMLLPIPSHPPDANAQSPDRNTERQSYMQVDQATMNMLSTAGVTQPQPINGPGDGEPVYLIPCQIYMQYMYITSPSLPNDTVNKCSCPIDPSLLEENTTPPQKQVPHLKPQRLVGGKWTIDPIARAKERALIALGMPAGTAALRVATVPSAMAQVSSAQGGLASTQVALASAKVASALATAPPATAQVALAMAQVGTATAQGGMATATVKSAQKSLQQMTLPSAQEAILSQTVGKRPRNKKVKFASQ